MENISLTVAVPPQKLTKIIDQIRTIQGSSRLTLRDLQSLVGRLLWLTSAWHYLRPLLIPLYKALHRIPTTMVSMDHTTFQAMITQLDEHLQLRSSLTHKHQSLRPGVTPCRVANSHVKTLADVKSLHIKSRRVWLGILDPTSPQRKVDDEASETLQDWLQLLVSTPFFFVDVCPNMDSSPSVGGRNGLDFYGRFGWCSHLPRWFISLVPIPYLIRRSADTLARTG